MKQGNVCLIGFYALLSVSLAWLLTIWMRFGISDSMETAAYMVDDLLWLGPAAFILDLLFFYLLFRWLLNRSKGEESDTLGTDGGSTE